MNSRSGSIFCLLAINLILASNSVISQDLPSDFEVIATAGGLMPGSTIKALHILHDGNVTYSKFKSTDPAGSPVENQQFNLTTEQLNQIWQAIKDNGFFALDTQYINQTITDRTYASLTAKADSKIHTVWTKNVGVRAFDRIIDKINSLILPQYKLSYDTLAPPVFEQKDICERSGSKAVQYIIKPSEENPEPAPEIRPESNKNGATTAHPGTSVAAVLSLQQAVYNGIADAESKGGYWGDEVSITVANNTPTESKSAVSKIFIEFYGNGATLENAQRAEIAIESMWGDKTSPDGRKFDVDVVIRVSDSNTPPGTPGYHQIELVNAEFDSSVDGVGTTFDVNRGVATGQWSTQGGQLSEIYAHEGGHLMGLPDQYLEYGKQFDGSWKRYEDGKTFSSSDIAGMYASLYKVSEADLKSYLDDPNNNRWCPPKPGHETDIMGSLEWGVAQNADIEAIASQASLAVNISSGDILTDKFDGAQNLAITRDEYLFLMPGETKQLEGLYAACIDYHDLPPIAGYPFDVTENLKHWKNFNASGYLLQLLKYINENDLFCYDKKVYQKLIWRLTDNVFLNDTSIDSRLLKAGIDIGNRFLDFPRIDNAYRYVDDSYFLIPQQLYTIYLGVSPELIINHPQNLTVDAKIKCLIYDDITSDFTWTLKKPAGSSTTLSSLTGNNTNFSPDTRGIYRLYVTADFTDLMHLNNVINDSALIVLSDNYTETFESGAISSTQPFKWITSDPGKWEINDEISHTGKYSICSGKIDDNKKSEMYLDVMVEQDDSISFAYTIFSDIYDYLRFYIDDVQIGSWSGHVYWSIAKYPVSKGNHRLKWTYEKNWNGSFGLDRCFIDDIFIPNNAVTKINDEFKTDGLTITAYPNPSDEYVTLKYNVASRQKTSIYLFDTNGKLLRILKDEIMEPGNKMDTFNLKGLVNGKYIIKIMKSDNLTGSVVFIKD